MSQCDYDVTNDDVTWLSVTNNDVTWLSVTNNDVTRRCDVTKRDGQRRDTNKKVCHMILFTVTWLSCDGVDWDPVILYIKPETCQGAPSPLPFLPPWLLMGDCAWRPVALVCLSSTWQVQQISKNGLGCAPCGVKQRYLVKCAPCSREA